MALYGIGELESCSVIYIKNLRMVLDGFIWYRVMLYGVIRYWGVRELFGFLYQKFENGIVWLYMALYGILGLSEI